MARTMTEDTRRRWVVLAAVYLTMIQIGVTSYMSGIIYSAILERFNEDRAKSSLIVSLNSSLLCLLGPLVSVVINRFSGRISMVTGGVILTLSGLASSYADNVNWLILTYGIFGGIGNALVIAPGSVILSYYFTKKRNFILSLYMTIIAVGMFFAAPVAMTFLEQYALNGTFLMIGAFNAHVCIFGVLCKPSKLENKIRNKRKRTDFSSQGIEKECFIKQKEKSYIIKLYNFFSLKSLIFLLFLICTFTWNAVLSIFLVHLPSFSSLQGADDKEISIVMACLSLCNIAGRVTGIFVVSSNRVNSLVIHALCMCLMSVVCVVCPFYGSKDAIRYVLAVATGLLTGVPNSMMTPITIKLMGVESISMAHGWEFFFCGLGVLVGPPIFAGFYSRTDSYNSGLIFAGVLSLVGCVLAIVVDRLHSVLQTTRAEAKEVCIRVEEVPEKPVTDALIQA